MNKILVFLIIILFTSTISVAQAQDNSRTNVKYDQNVSMGSAELFSLNSENLQSGEPSQIMVIMYNNKNTSVNVNCFAKVNNVNKGSFSKTIPKNSVRILKKEIVINRTGMVNIKIESNYDKDKMIHKRIKD